MFCYIGSAIGSRYTYTCLLTLFADMRLKNACKVCKFSSLILSVDCKKRVKKTYQSCNNSKLQICMFHELASMISKKNLQKSNLILILV